MKKILDGTLELESIGYLELESIENFSAFGPRNLQ